MNGMPAQRFAHDAFGWAVIMAGGVATLVTIFAAIYWSVRPGELDPRHPKYLILRNDR